MRRRKQHGLEERPQRPAPPPPTTVAAPAPTSNSWLDRLSSLVENDHDTSTAINTTIMSARQHDHHHVLTPPSFLNNENDCDIVGRIPPAITNHEEDDVLSLSSPLVRRDHRSPGDKKVTPAAPLSGRPPARGSSPPPSSRTTTFLEEPEEGLLVEMIGQMDDEISLIRNKPAYERACRTNPRYVTDRKFRLLFLRADLYNPKLAAARLVLFLEKKLQFFGSTPLARDLTLDDDFDKKDIATLKSGVFQFLPNRDRFGHKILVDFSLRGPSLCPQLDDSFMKVLIYMTLCGTTDDDATQKKGLVYILYWMGDFRTSNNDKDDQDLIISKEALLSHKWLPVRPAFVHLCFNDPVIAVLERMFMHITPRHLRSIFSTHRGTHMEVQYQLMTYGILPICTIPVSSEGKVKTAFHSKWIWKRRVKEAFERIISGAGGGTPPSIVLDYGDILEKKNRIDIPYQQDVLLGKGLPYQQHPGNFYLRFLIDQKRREYSAARRKGDKTLMVRELVKKIQVGSAAAASAGEEAAGGRFLKKDSEDWWVVASDQEAFSKVHKTFMTLQALAKREELHDRRKKSRSGTTTTTTTVGGSGSSSSFCSSSGPRPPAEEETMNDYDEDDSYDGDEDETGPPRLPSTYSGTTATATAAPRPVSGGATTTTTSPTIMIASNNKNDNKRAKRIDP